MATSQFGPLLRRDRSVTFVGSADTHPTHHLVCSLSVTKTSEFVTDLSDILQRYQVCNINVQRNTKLPIPG